MGRTDEPCTLLLLYKDALKCWDSIESPGSHYLHLFLKLCYRNGLNIILTGSLKLFYWLKWNFAAACLTTNQLNSLDGHKVSFRYPGCSGSLWTSWIIHRSKWKHTTVLQLLQDIHIKLKSPNILAALFCIKWTSSRFPCRVQEGNWTCPS